MPHDLDEATRDLYSTISFSGGGSSGGGGRNPVSRALTAGRERAVARGGGYSDGGNWRTALDVNANGRVLDDAVLGLGLFASFSPAGRLVNTAGRIATGLGIVDHFRN